VDPLYYLRKGKNFSVPRRKRRGGDKSSTSYFFGKKKKKGGASFASIAKRGHRRIYFEEKGKRRGERGEKRGGVKKSNLSRPLSGKRKERKREDE